MSVLFGRNDTRAIVKSRLKKLLCIIASIPVLMTREDDDMIFHFQASKSDLQLILGLCLYTDF